MKAHEKWWKEKYDEPRYDDNPLRYAISKTVWKAALEWVQSRLKFGSGVAYSTDDILMAIKKEIREELEK